MKQLVIPLFIPHYGCPHQCIFCNQCKITGMSTPITANVIEKTVSQYIKFAGKGKKIEAAFYGGSFTALPSEKQQELLEPVYRYFKQGLIKNVRVSTRPDAIDADKVKLLESFGVSTIELGVQSFSDRVLQAAERGHTEADIYKAIKVIKEFGLRFGIQLMLGLPKEEWSDFISSVYKTIDCKPNMVRLYPTLVLTDTKLAKLYKAGQYIPLALNEAVRRAAFAKALLEVNRINVIRTGLQDTEELRDPLVRIAGPYHAAFGEMVEAYMFYITVANFLESWDKTLQSIIIYHHPQDASKVRGIGKNNVILWKRKYLTDIHFCQDSIIRPGEIRVEYNGMMFLLNKYKIVSC